MSPAIARSGLRGLRRNGRGMVLVSEIVEEASELGQVIVLVGALLAAISIGLLGLAVVAGQGDLLGRDVAWVTPYVGGGGVVAAGLGLTAAAICSVSVLASGTIRSPCRLPGERRHEGLQG